MFIIKRQKRRTSFVDKLLLNDSLFYHVRLLQQVMNLESNIIYITKEKIFYYINKRLEISRNALELNLNFITIQ